MARHGPKIHDQPLQEDDYIDMELSSPAAAEVATNTASLLCYTTTMAASPQNSREFEFYMSAPVNHWEPMASPADELFYKGKLLPLHLPPRIQMVERLLEIAADKGLLSASTAPTTPYQSCSVSPANSCYASGELNAEQYFSECTAANIAAAEVEAACGKKPWSKKLKFIKNLNLGLKLKASKAYLKTVFATKAGDPDEKGRAPRANEFPTAQVKSWKKNPFVQIRSNRYTASPISNSAPLGGKLKEDEFGHRRSFSSVIIRYSSSNKTSSASSSSCSSSNSSSSIPSSNDSGLGPVLRRSSSASSEMDNPIQSAIAYCKKSQQLASVRKSGSDAGFRFMSSSASKIAAESEDAEDILEICRPR